MCGAHRGDGWWTAWRWFPQIAWRVGFPQSEPGSIRGMRFSYGLSHMNMVIPSTGGAGITGVVSRKALLEVCSPFQIRNYAKKNRWEYLDGWYATEDAPPEVRQSYRNKMRPTCISACKLWGLWTPPFSRVHAYKPRYAFNGQQVKTDFAPAILPHRPWLDSWPDRGPIASPARALAHAGRCLEASEVAILLESALNTGLLGRGDIDEIIEGYPVNLRRRLRRVDGLSQSGSETKVKVGLQARGVKLRQQVFIDGVGYVDILVGKSLVIECDSYEFHDDVAQYATDRARDLRLHRLGYTVIRLTWWQIHRDWERTLAALVAVISTGAHHRLPIGGD